MPSVVVDVMYSVPSMKTIFKANILKELNEKCTELCKKNTLSILRKNQYPDLAGFDWNSILSEISQRYSLLLDVMTTTIGSKLKSNTIPSICLCYGIPMWKQNHDLSLIQRINILFYLQKEMLRSRLIEKEHLPVITCKIIIFSLKQSNLRLCNVVPTQPCLHTDIK